MKQPIRGELIRPPLVFGVPRLSAVGLVCLCAFIALLGHWIAALVLFAVVWGLLAAIMKHDHRIPQILLRELSGRAPGNHLRK